MKNTFRLLLLTLLFTACGGGSDDTGFINPETGQIVNPNNINANTTGGAYATLYEQPHINSNDVFLTYTTTFNGKQPVTYSIAYNSERKHARWVAFTFEGSNKGTGWDRNDWDHTEWQGDPWDYAPEIPKEEQMDSRRGIKSTYGLSGYDRGHLVASFDRVYSQDANRQTFYSINMSPMKSTFNQKGPWNKLETKINNRSSGWVTSSDVLYVVKGATIREGEYTIKNTLTIPNHYFMALVRKKDNAYYSIAFLIEHNNNTGTSLSKCAMSIDELETITGIDFFCNLPDKLENTLESTLDLKPWNL